MLTFQIITRSRNFYARLCAILPMLFWLSTCTVGHQWPAAEAEAHEINSRLWL